MQKKHNLVSIMAQAMEKLGFESDSDIWKRWLKEKKSAYLQKCAYGCRVKQFKIFEKNNICTCFLK